MLTSEQREKGSCYPRWFKVRNIVLEQSNLEIEIVSHASGISTSSRVQKNSIQKTTARTWIFYALVQGLILKDYFKEFSFFVRN